MRPQGRVALPVPQRWRRNATWLVSLAVVAALGVLPASVPMSIVQEAPASPAALSLDADSPAAELRGLAAILSDVEAAVQPLRRQVDAGHIVPKFGEKAQGILEAARGAPEVERAVDAMLQTLFLRQLALLRQQTAAKFEKGTRPAEAVAQADQQFQAQARELARLGSTWSFDRERYALRAALEGAFRRDAALVEEKQRAAETQQSTVEVISKLQSQMETLQQRVQHMRAGSPWFVSSHYRIPGTPLQLIGRYHQGRANLELSLSADRDPANAQAGFVEGVGPANLGVSLNVGL